MKKLSVFTGSILLVMFFCLSAICIAQEPPSEDAVQFESALKKAGAYINSLNNYRTVVELRERIKGKIKGFEKVQGTIVRSPVKMHFIWLKPGNDSGMEASYVKSRDGKNHLLAKEGGILGFVPAQKLSFDSSLIKKMHPHHHDINQYHLDYLLGLVSNIYKKAKAAGKAKVAEQGKKPDSKSGLTLDFYELDLPDDPAAGFSYSKVILGFDPKNGLPRRIEFYNFSGQIYAKYEVLSFKPNIAVDEAIFNLGKKD